MKDVQVKIIAVILTICGAGLCYLKVERLGLPLTPAEKAAVWTVEARVTFEATGSAIKASLILPAVSSGFLLLNEDFISQNYGLSVETVNGQRNAIWTVRRARGEQALYYRLYLFEEARQAPAGDEPAPGYPEVPDYKEPFRSAVLSLLEEVRSESADILSFTSQLLHRLNAPIPDENVKVIRAGVTSQSAWANLIVEILAGARIPARVIYGLQLKDGVVDDKLTPWLEVHNDERWTGFDPYGHEPGYPKRFYVWHRGTDKLLRVKGGENQNVSFSVSSGLYDVMAVARERAARLDSALLSWSLFELPIRTQNVYRILLMVPLGALVIILVRNIIGIPTYGTFMPILIALAFRETEVGWGIVLFSLIVFLGLSLRFYLERLKLLLVPRLASVLIIVILLMLVISLVSAKLGLERGLSVALFPMVILSMIIERMSITWEEHGPADAIKQSLGSLSAALLGYLVMNETHLMHLVFVFPELLLVVLAIALISGRYTGYRLSELWRFRDLAAP